MGQYTKMLNQPIQMIASCSTAGEFTPIRFRYESPSCELITIHIVSVESRKHSYLKNNCEMTYTCRGIADDCDEVRSYFLRYYIPGHTWTLTGIGR